MNKKMRLIAALGALALCTATVVWGDYNVLDKSTHYQNAPTGLRVNSTGDLRVDDMARDRDNWRLIPILANQLTASGAGMVDSNTTPVLTGDFSRMNLSLRVAFDSLSTVVRIAVQVRGHFSTANDSASMFPWYRWPTRATSNGTTDIDSLGHMFVGTYAQAQLTSANQPFAGGGLWPGEFEVKFNVASTDSTAAGNGKYGAYPNTMLIPLCDAGGAWFCAPYTSVRFRVLNGVRSRFKITANLMGVSK